MARRPIPREIMHIRRPNQGFFRRKPIMIPIIRKTFIRHEILIYAASVLHASTPTLRDANSGQNPNIFRKKTVQIRGQLVER